MSKRVATSVSENTVELITLQSFNIGQLNEVKNFVKEKNDPRLSYLTNIIDKKIISLLDNTEITYKNKIVKKYVNFINQTVTKEFIKSIIQLNNLGVNSYDGLKDDPIKEDDSLNTENNEKNINKNEVEIGEGSVVLKDPIQTEVQSTDCGCWSCSLNVLLKSEGVNDLGQEDIRAYRPNANKINTDTLNLLSDRLQFLKRASTDSFNEINDYTDLIHKKTNNIAFKSKQITNGIDYVYNEAKRILEENKKPISFLYKGHYRTLVGVDNGNFIFEDSLVNKNGKINYYKTLDRKKMSVKYPNYSVEHKDNIGNNNEEIVLSWLEKIDDNKIDEYLKNNLNGKGKSEYFLRNEGTLFSKFEPDQNQSGLTILEEIVLPNNLLEKIDNIDEYLNENENEKDDLDNDFYLIDDNKQNDLSLNTQNIKEDNSLTSSKNESSLFNQDVVEKVDIKGRLESTFGQNKSQNNSSVSINEDEKNEFSIFDKENIEYLNKKKEKKLTTKK